MTAAGSMQRFGVYAANEWQVEVTASWRKATRVPPIIWCHGVLVDGRVIRQGAGGIPGFVYYDTMAEIADRLGTVLISADYGGASTWANDTAIGRIDTMVTWAGANLGTRTDRVIVAGESMGTLLALNWAWRNWQKVLAVWLRGPIVRMLDFYNANPGGLAALMDAAYTNHAGFLAALPTHDPAQNMAALTVLGPVTRLDATRDDELIPAMWAPQYAATTGALARLHPGTHADNVYVDRDEVADWLYQTTRSAA